MQKIMGCYWNCGMKWLKEDLFEIKLIDLGKPQNVKLAVDKIQLFSKGETVGIHNLKWISQSIAVEILLKCAIFVCEIC